MYEICLQLPVRFAAGPLTWCFHVIRQSPRCSGRSEVSPASMLSGVSHPHRATTRQRISAVLLTRIPEDSVCRDAKAHRVKQHRTRSRSPGMWCRTVVHRSAKRDSKVIRVFSDFACDRRGVRVPEARYLAGNPQCSRSRPALKAPFSSSPLYLHQSHRGYSDLNNRPQQRIAACRCAVHHQLHRSDKGFYRLISEGHFPEPIKPGRSSRGYRSEVEQWMQQRTEESRGGVA